MSLLSLRSYQLREILEEDSLLSLHWQTETVRGEKRREYLQRRMRYTYSLTLQIKEVLPYAAKLSHADLIKRIEDAGVSRAQAAAIAQDINLTRLKFNEAQNWSDAQGSWYMKHISPYLPDLLKGSSSALSVRRSFK